MFGARRFTAALLTVNFVAVPVLVWLLSLFLPQHPPLLLGVYLVLLTPCIDYVIVFT
ncbi:MAG: arsenic resistance protein, partial [Desulfurivibrionaceae bacterium]